MSWVYVPASGGLSSAFIELAALELSATLSKTLGAWLRRLQESGTVYLWTHQSGQISKHSMARLGVASWIASLRASRVNPFPSPGGEKARKMSGGSGPKSSESFARYDPESSCWRTSQGSLFEGLDGFSETWPRAGMTVNGMSYRLSPSAPRTLGRECSLWATPASWDAVGSHGGGQGRSLRTDVRRWPTPRQFMHKDSPEDRGKGNLGEVVGGQLNPMWVEWLMGFPIGWTALEPLEMP